MISSNQSIEVLLYKYDMANRQKIIDRLGPVLYQLAEGHCHLTKELVDAILSDIKNA